MQALCCRARVGAQGGETALRITYPAMFRCALKILLLAFAFWGFLTLCLLAFYLAGWMPKKVEKSTRAAVRIFKAEWNRAK